MLRRSRSLTLFIVLAIGTGCSTISPLLPPIFGVRSTQTGIASWYGGELSGRRTASGEKFNPGALTAAHPHHEFGTRLRVTNLRTGRSVVVRVNDRGPHVRGRLIDLSQAAASRIGIVGGGTAKVRVERLN